MTEPLGAGEPLKLSIQSDTPIPTHITAPPPPTGSTTHGHTITVKDTTTKKDSEGPWETAKKVAEVVAAHKDVIIVVASYAATVVGAGLAVAVTFPLSLALGLPIMLVAGSIFTHYTTAKGEEEEQKKGDAGEFMSRFSGAQSYHKAMNWPGSKGKTEPTSLKDILKKTGYKATSSLKRLDECYWELRKIDDPKIKNDLLDTSPDGFTIPVGGTSESKRQEIMKLGLTNKQKDDLKAKFDLNDDQVSQYVDYWKNFLALNVAAKEGEMEESSFFIKQPS